MLKPRRLAVLFVAISVTILPGPALAYIGPGAGVGAIAVTFAVLLGALLLAVGLVWYPLKRLLKGRKRANDTPRATDSTE